MKSAPSPSSSEYLWEVRIAGLVVIGLLLFLFEALIPKPVPWLKLGVANVVTLIALYWLNWRAAVWVSVLRIFSGALLTGNLLTPGFYLSAGGGIAALIVMLIAFAFLRPGIVTLSALGGMAHGSAQLLIARYLIFNNPFLGYLLLPIMLSGIVTGAVVGFIGYQLLIRLQQGKERRERTMAGAIH